MRPGGAAASVSVWGAGAGRTEKTDYAAFAPVTGTSPCSMSGVQSIVVARDIAFNAAWTHV